MRQTPVMSLSDELRRELEVAGQAVRQGIEDRNRLIARAHAAGASLREIAEAVGLSHMGVRKVLDRQS